MAWTDSVARQLRLSLRRPPSYDRPFVIGPSNREAQQTLSAWPDWPGGALALVGPPGVGKTHLARLWAQAADAQALSAVGPEVGDEGPVLIEDVDQGFADELLFHRINMAQRPGGGLLLTARTAPALWTTTLQDLRSRLNALPVAEVAPPDDEVLAAVLRAAFERCNIRPPDDVVTYLTRRIERSVPAAWEVVTRLDAAAGESNRPISRVLARQVLENDTENLDLFE